MLVLEDYVDLHKYILIPLEDSAILLMQKFLVIIFPGFSMGEEMAKLLIELMFEGFGSLGVLSLIIERKSKYIVKIPVPPPTPELWAFL